uniref:Uncharacterized protein n=1 Tax=Sipha flava TaxID=143950 RepID=A0A2S2QLC7_9HEMI
MRCLQSTDERRKTFSNIVPRYKSPTEKSNNCIALVEVFSVVARRIPEFYLKKKKTTKKTTSVSFRLLTFRTIDRIPVTKTTRTRKLRIVDDDDDDDDDGCHGRRKNSETVTRRGPSVPLLTVMIGAHGVP